MYRDVSRLTWQVDFRQHDFHVFLQRPNPVMPVELLLAAADCDDRCVGQLATVVGSLMSQHTHFHMHDRQINISQVKCDATYSTVSRSITSNW